MRYLSKYKLITLLIIFTIVFLTVLYLDRTIQIHFPWEQYSLEFEKGSVWVNPKIDGVYMSYKNLFKIPYNPSLKFKETKSNFNKADILKLDATSKITGGEIFTFTARKSNESNKPILLWESFNRESKSLLINGINWTHYPYSNTSTSPRSWQTFPDLYVASFSDYTVVFSTYNRGYNQILVNAVLPSFKFAAVESLF